MSKSAQNTHLTAEPISKQCAVYDSRPLIASKPGSSSPEQYNRFKRSRIFDSKTKIKFHSRELETPGSHRESKSDLLTENSDFFFDSHGYERKLNLISNKGFSHVPTPAKHVLLVHMSMLQGLKMHQGLKIKHIFTHQKLECLLVNVEPRELRWLVDRLPIQRSRVRTSGQDKKLLL